MSTRVGHSGQVLTGEFTNSPGLRDGGKTCQKPGGGKGKKGDVWLPCPFRVEDPEYYAHVTINCPAQTYNGLSDLK